MMGLFFKNTAKNVSELNKPLNSDEYDKVLMKISEIRGELYHLKTQLLVLETNYNDLRGKFNRKLSILSNDKEEEEKKDKFIGNNFLKF